VVGLTTASALLGSGYRVTLLERGPVGQEASWAGGGILSPLCPWDYQEPVTRLALRGMGMFHEFAAALRASTGIDPEYERSGMLLLPPCRPELAKEWCCEHGFTCQEVDLASATPSMSGSGLLLPDVAQVRNPCLIHALRRHIELLGGEILEFQEAIKFQVEDDRIVALQTSQGPLRSDVYVLAAGAWSSVLLGEHALGMDIKPIKGQILLFKFDVPPFRQILLKESLYLIPRRDGHVLAGSTLEDVGFDKSVTADARDDLLRRIWEIFPQWRNHDPIRQWAGLRPGSPGNIPTIGRHPLLLNLYANSGHFRYGVTMSLASAELLVNEIEGKSQPLIMDNYLWH
jgi:glycine oxidase